MHPVCWGEAGKAPQQTVAPCIVGSLARPRHHCYARNVLLPHAGEPSLWQEWPPTYGQNPYRKTSSQCIQARQEAGAQAEEGQEQQTREGLEERTHKRTRLAADPRPIRQCSTTRPEAAARRNQGIRKRPAHQMHASQPPPPLLQSRHPITSTDPGPVQHAPAPPPPRAEPTPLPQFIASPFLAGFSTM